MKKTAIITGGGRGIGFAIAYQLGLDGYNVAIMGRSKEREYQDNFDTLAQTGIEYLYIQGSVDKEESRTACVEKTVSRFGRIDVLINNAGVAPVVRNDLLEMSEESFDRVIGINLKGTLFMSQAAARQMINQELIGARRGIIVNISSISAAVSSINRGEYCVSKAGMSMVTTLFADRLAGEGIFVNEIRPGVIETEMTAKVKEKYDQLIEEGIFPIKRWGQPEDIAGAVSALCSDKFLYTTGTHLYVDGGFHIRKL